MPAICLTEVISYSSEDPKFPASNILLDKKWLTKPGDILQTCQIEIRLEHLTPIDFIDIGYINTGAIEMKVGRSTWSSDKYALIMPATKLHDSRVQAQGGKNICGCKMFKCPEHLDADICIRRWDRILIILHEKLTRHKQMGLEFVRIGIAEKRAQVAARSKPPSHQLGELPFQEFKSEISSEGRNLQKRLLEMHAHSVDNQGLHRAAKILLSSKSSHQKVHSKNSNSVICEKVTNKDDDSGNKDVKIDFNTPSTSRQIGHLQICTADVHGNTVDNDVEEVTKNPVATETTPLRKREIKRIKRFVTSFFNTFEPEDVDPNNITLKELRVGFEAMYDVTLDPGGRRYFGEAAADFLELVMKIKKHKSESHVANDDLTLNEGKRKRKSRNDCETPTKVTKISSDLDDCVIVDSTAGVQCPLCMNHFPSELIVDHAASCGEIVMVPDSIVQGDQARIVSSIDLSDNMGLTEAEKRHWLNFSSKPKPYHPRMDKALFKDHELVKCPTCGQRYKSIDIEEHSDDCAAKVNSGLVKRGLYFVKNK